jgi:glycosyltransferase involved in cell wall biosynthesis
VSEQTAGGTVSVIVPVRDEAAVLADTLETILGQDWPAIEFLFVDGRSRDGSREQLDAIAARDARVRVIDNPQGDLASALALGFAAARGDYVAKLDAHTFFPAGYVRAGVRRLERGGTAWVSGPPLPFGIDAGSRRVAAALGTRLGVGGSAKWALSGEREWELDTGVFSGIWPRDVLARFGGWDPGWPVNEDAELASRFLAAGERLVCLAEMAARYVPRSTLRGLGRQYGRYGFYRAKTAGRHPRSLRRSALLPPAVVATLAVCALGGRPGRRLTAAPLLAYLAAVGGQSAKLAGTLGAREAALTAPVYLVMHLSWGAGFLAGCARFGPPTAALAHVLSARG